MLKKMMWAIMLFTLAGCSTTERAVFFTKTSISVLDVDSTPAAISVAYDRTEGYLGPSYPNGATPSVVGSFKSDGQIINPKIKQVYATGRAAEIVTAKNQNDSDAQSHNNLEYSDDSDKKMMFFGTSTALGIKIGVEQNNPAFLLGFKRKEASYIPLQGVTVNGKKRDQYASVLASIDTDVDFTATEQKLKYGQFFATGKAAKQLAQNGNIRAAFAEKATVSFDQEFSDQAAAQGEATHCSFSVKQQDWNTIIQSGMSSGVLTEEEIKEQVLAANQAYQASGSAADQLQLIRAHSTAVSGATDGMSAKKSILINAHRNLVCDLARKK